MPSFWTLPDKGFMSDPVWGEMVFYYGTSPSYLQLLCFGFCPWLFVGCGGRWRCCNRNRPPGSTKDARRAWRRFLLSFSTLVSLVQCVLLIVCLFHGAGFEALDRNPMIGPDSQTLDSLGAKNAARVLYKGEWWRLLTTLLLHGGLLHLLMNVMVQMRIGVTLEVLWGHHNWLLIYLASGGYSVLVSCIFLPDSLTVGASGSICGVIGAGLMFSLMTWTQIVAPREVRDRNMRVCTLGTTMLVTLLLSAVPMVDFAAHIGGFLAGFVLAVGVFADRLDTAGSSNVPTAMKAIAGTSYGIAVFATQVYFAQSTKPSRALLGE